ncbi:MAG TPA: hypothetical protein VN962_23385 [Polyangia bacterium]|nr:hypothetical protein [Polyangia bacterium]
MLLSLMAGGCATTGVDAPVNHETTLRAKLEQARALRTSGHGDAALSVLDEALKLEARWGMTPDGELRALRDAEIAGAAETIDADLRRDLDGGAPLAAQKHAATLEPLVQQPPLRPLGDKMRARIAEAGKVRCGELAGRQKGDTPYLARLLVDYCTRVGGTFQAPPPPEQSRGLRVSGRLAHMADAQHQIVEAWLADVFRASPWYAADAPELAPLQLGGAYDARLERRFVTITVPYRVVVRSKVSNAVLGDLGPTANLETETERTFEYQAERYDARYGLNATLTLEVGTGPPLVVSVQHTDSKRAFEHDVRFPAANVYPQRANLPDINAWLTTFLGTKRTPLLRKLRERWVKAFCSQRQYTPEEAARCLQAGQRVPAAEKALAAVFGDDTPAVVENVTRPRGDERKPAGTKAAGAPAVPEVQDVPQPGAAQSI